MWLNFSMVQLLEAHFSTFSAAKCDKCTYASNYRGSFDTISAKGYVTQRLN